LNDWLVSWVVPIEGQGSLWLSPHQVKIVRRRADVVPDNTGRVRASLITFNFFKFTDNIYEPESN
jgi:hypothetical protein